MSKYHWLMNDPLIRELVIEQQYQVIDRIIPQLSSLRSFNRAHFHLRALVDIWVETGGFFYKTATNRKQKELLEKATIKLLNRFEELLSEFRYSNRRVRVHHKIVSLINKIHGWQVYSTRFQYIRSEVLASRISGYCL